MQQPRQQQQQQYQTQQQQQQQYLNQQQQQQQQQYQNQQQIQSTIRKTDSETFSIPRPNQKQVPSNVQIKSRQQRLHPSSPIFRKVNYFLLSVFKFVWMDNIL